MGSVFSSIGNAFKSVLSGIENFMSSPFGKLLMGIGLTVLTGGLGAPLMGALGGLGSLGGIAGSLGSMGSIFSSVAGNFLGPFSSLLSNSGLGALSGFLGNAGDSGGLLNMVSSLLTSQSNTDQSNQQPGAQDIANQNLFDLTAYNQAQMLA